MGINGITMRAATVKDADALVWLSRVGFQKSPEWRAPSFMIRRWWRDVISHPKCMVRVAVCSDSQSEPYGGVIGYCVATLDHSVWDAKMHSGPHSKWMKVLIMLTNPTVRRAYLKKRRQVKEISRTTATQKDASTESDDMAGDSDQELGRVCIADIVDERGDLYLALMAVDPRMRGRGTATKMIEHFVEIGHEQCVGTIWMHVDPRNKKGQDRYAQWGYTLRGRHGNSLLMSKRIPND